MSRTRTEWSVGSTIVIAKAKARASSSTSSSIIIIAVVTATQHTTRHPASSPSLAHYQSHPRSNFEPPKRSTSSLPTAYQSSIHSAHDRLAATPFPRYHSLPAQYHHRVTDPRQLEPRDNTIRRIEQLRLVAATVTFSDSTTCRDQQRRLEQQPRYEEQQFIRPSIQTRSRQTRTVQSSRPDAVEL